MDPQDPTPPAENTVAVEDNSAPASPAAEPTTSVETPVETPAEGEPTPTAEPAPTTPVEPEHQPARPAERRIRDLASDNKRLVEENANLLAQVPATSPQTPTLSSMVAGRDSIDPSELDKIGEQFVAQTGQAAATLEVSKLRFEMQQKEAASQFQSDVRKVEKLYPELNEDSPEYNPVIAEKVQKNWEARAIQVNPLNPKIKTINPQVRLADVAKDFMEVAKAAGAHGQQTASAALAASEDTAALTPSASAPAPEVAFEDMTLKQQEAELRKKGHKF
jgi:hypothetical protein